MIKRTCINGHSFDYNVTFIPKNCFNWKCGVCKGVADRDVLYGKEGVEVKQ